MHARFELSTKISIDQTIFENMKKEAEELLCAAESDKFTQAIVLFSVKENMYSAIIKNVLADEKTDEKSLLEQLKSAKDTEIRYLLSMWADRELDISSYAFRELLCSLNPKNAEAVVFVTTFDGVSAITIDKTMR
ncbi:MAG: hypothetical protein IIU77_05710 [Clostridia bacterium]|nr:hypothetical protein [Clostridia bacterium]